MKKRKVKEKRCELYTHGSGGVFAAFDRPKTPTFWGSIFVEACMSRDAAYPRRNNGLGAALKRPNAGYVGCSCALRWIAGEMSSPLFRSIIANVMDVTDQLNVRNQCRDSIVDVQMQRCVSKGL